MRGLFKRYGAVEAVRGVSFDVARGEIFGILGPNGAGKSSILECLLGLRRPDSGSLEIEGVDVVGRPDVAKAKVGAQIQLSSLQDRITVREALSFYASFYGDAADIEAVLVRFGLAGKARAAFASLSGGQRQRLFLALAFVNNPTLVVLDEPTSGLDVHSRRELHHLIRDMRSAGQTVLLSTHYLEEAAALCDRVAILSEGRIVAAGSPAELLARARGGLRLQVRTATPLDAAQAAALSEAAAFRLEGDGCWLETRDPGKSLAAVAKHLEATGNTLLDVHVHRPSLEDVFIELTGKPWTGGRGEEQP